MRILKVFCGLLIFFFMAGLFLIAGEAKAAEPIKLGAVLPMVDQTGKDILRGMQLAVKQVNEGGGILGRRLELIVADDELKPEKAAAGLEKLAAVDKVDIFIGGMSSAAMMAMLPGMKKYAKVTVWCGVSSYKVEEALESQDWFFHLYPWDYQNWQMTNKGWMQIMQKYPQIKLKRVFFAYEESSYGTGYFKSAKTVADSAGYELKGVPFKTAAMGGGDYRAMLKQAKEFKPDMYIWVGYEKDAIPMLEQAKEIGFNPPIYLGWPPAWPEEIATHPLNEGVFFYTFWNDVIKYSSKTSKAFCDAFNKEYKQPPASFAAPLGYTNIMIVAEAIKRAGSLDKPALIKSLEATNYESPLGDRFVFRKSNFINHQASAQLKFMQWQKGRIVVIWPWEFATGRIEYPFPAKDNSKGAVAEEKKSADVKAKKKK
jgi:branched-chain amino acid transport system substrate-binding protein